MIKYEKLPNGTPKKIETALFWLGGLLGFSIFVETFIAIRGLSGFFHQFLFPNSPFVMSLQSSVMLGLIGLFAMISAGLIIMLAMNMNGLTRNSIKLARWVWLPTLITSLLMIANNDMANAYSPTWILGSALALIFAGGFPYILLSTLAGRKLHNR